MDLFFLGLTTRFIDLNMDLKGRVCPRWAHYVGTQTPGLGPYTLETAIGGRYAEYYGGWVWKRCAIAMWFNVRVYWSIPLGFKFNWPPN